MVISHSPTRTLTKLGAVTAACIALVFALTAQVQQQGRNVSPKGGEPNASASAQAAEARLLAYRLADLGRRTNNPLALASAAQIMLDVGSRELGAKATAEAAKPPAGAKADGQKQSASRPTDAAALLAEAQQMATGNDAALAVIRQLQTRAQQGTRGHVEGPQEGWGRANAYGAVSYRMTFVGGEPAVVGVRGDGDTDLDCFVYDQNGNLIASDTDGTDVCLLGWRPRWTGPFRVRILNLGRVYNDYRIVTN